MLAVSVPSHVSRLSLLSILGTAICSVFVASVEGNYGLLSLRLFPIIPFHSCQVATTMTAKGPDVTVCKLLLSWQRYL